jgi:diacylglycerol kinase
LLAIALVWTTEAINTAIEKIVDFISPDFHPKAGEIKDLAAGAVLIASLFALITGLIIFVPKLF